MIYNRDQIVNKREERELYYHYETTDEYEKRMEEWNKERIQPDKNGTRIITGVKWHRVDYLSHCMRKYCAFRMIGKMLYYSPLRFKVDA